MLLNFSWGAIRIHQIKHERFLWFDSISVGATAIRWGLVSIWIDWATFLAHRSICSTFILSPGGLVLWVKYWDAILLLDSCHVDELWPLKLLMRGVDVRLCVSLSRDYLTLLLPSVGKFFYRVFQNRSPTISCLLSLSPIYTVIVGQPQSHARLRLVQVVLSLEDCRSLIGHLSRLVMTLLGQYCS